MYEDFWVGEHAYWPIKRSGKKTQKLALWKPALGIRKQNSSHLQGFCNAFLIKGRAN